MVTNVTTYETCAFRRDKKYSGEIIPTRGVNWLKESLQERRSKVEV